MEPRGRLEEVVFETPDPPQRVAPQPPVKAHGEGLDTSATPMQAALETFAKKEVLPQVIYQRKPKPKSQAQPRCFPVVEQFLEREAVSCRRVFVERTFLHIHQDLGQPAKRRRLRKDGSRQPEAAWDEYLRTNGLEGCLAQSFLWRKGKELIFAVVPYPCRPNAQNLAEVLQLPADELSPVKLKEVQRITQLPLFVCLPFGVPEAARVVADEQLASETELIFDSGNVALLMSAAEFGRSVKPLFGRITAPPAEPAEPSEPAEPAEPPSGRAWVWKEAAQPKYHADTSPDVQIKQRRLNDSYSLASYSQMCDIERGLLMLWSSCLTLQHTWVRCSSRIMLADMTLKTRYWALLAPQKLWSCLTGRPDHKCVWQANGARRKREFEVGARSSFEMPEQRLARLQAEVSELLIYAEKSAAKDPAAAELLGADPGAMSTELKVLEQRLGALADGSTAWGRSSNRHQAGGYAMPSSLVSQLERLAGGEAQEVADGQVTYEINYAPSAASINDGAKIAAMESSVAEIEKTLGVLQPHPFPDLQTAIAQLSKRVSLLEKNGKIDTMNRGLEKVAKEVDHLLTKKAELEGTSDKDLDLKVSQLYDFCHRWSATAASLPLIVSRLQSLQALHLQSASFASRLAALEKQQEELTRLLETTSEAVQDLNAGLQENMTIVRDNMRSLEDKIMQAVRG
ncbi:unnamed protein product [Effrenium voratum]|nr:unnamed protein product [Effrenium voratum]